MGQPSDILKQYWGHDTFREPQEKIIASVLAGRDTFALMPTGGGKSICFQVPAMMKDGICLVISPLVALMKDQVTNLQQRNIKALSLTGGMSVDHISDMLDNCAFGNYKFLYLSPERLQSAWIVDRLKELPINLVAVDEAHCVSQWGHDFRPAYLKISTLKEQLKNVPFLALTASATQRVKKDIVEQLELINPQVFTSSFARPNLGYIVIEAEDKLFKIGQILNKNPEPSIIYVRNRKSCIELSAQLQSLGFTSTYYHGGLASAEKDRNMERWMKEDARVMVATNAFGMGIDKSNVKTVIHVQLPENIENYYQEAGRAGRNGKKAFAVLVVSPSDGITAENQFINILPDKAFLKSVYIKLCNYFQIAYGEAPEEAIGFNLSHFCLQYGFPAARTYNALQFLDRQGVISLSQEFSQKMVVQFIIPSREVIRFMSLNPADEQIILTILRTYPGIYDQRLALNHLLIAKKSGAEPEKVLNLLERLKKLSVIDYTAKNNDSEIIFNEVREDDHTINRISKYLEEQNSRKKQQLQSVLDYVAEKALCRSRQISEYFGDHTVENCRICSNCLQKRQPLQDKALPEKIIALLQAENLTSREIQEKTQSHETDVIFALRNLMEDEVLSIAGDNRYYLQNE
ncbi:MAG TPA: ATP-dependent DNA helicase RecQ [Flavobacterium sp.]|jgi:ATP-dependent DNA helicase RecQ